jgi:hypothetical protein
MENDPNGRGGPSTGRGPPPDIEELLRRGRSRLGIDTATIVPVKRQLKQEFGFTTPGATDPYQSPTDGRRETEMVTGDLNAALVEWVVQYRISEPREIPVRGSRAERNASLCLGIGDARGGRRPDC